LQEGYSVDLLEQPPRRTPTLRNPPPPQLPQPAQQILLTPGIAETGSGEKIGPPVYTPEAPKSQTSFWRTRNGVITVFVIVLIVIGAVVGGAVGGTVKKSNNNNVQTTGTDGVSSSPSTSSTATESGTQAIAEPNRPTQSNSPVSTPVSTQGSVGQISEAIEHMV